MKLGQADQVLRLVETELLPIVSGIAGFIAYQAIIVGPQSIVSVSTYSDRAAAESSNRAAAEWVEARIALMMDGPARVTVGQVRLAVNMAQGHSPGYRTDANCPDQLMAPVGISGATSPRPSVAAHTAAPFGDCM